MAENPFKLNISENATFRVPAVAPRERPGCWLPIMIAIGMGAVIGVLAGFLFF